MPGFQPLPFIHSPDLRAVCRFWRRLDCLLEEVSRMPPAARGTHLEVGLSNLLHARRKACLSLLARPGRVVLLSQPGETIP